MNKIEINKEKCTKCRLCVNDCVASCIGTDEEGYPFLKLSNNCIECQHCFSICPSGALSFNNISPNETENIDLNGDLLSLIKSRRSIRKYKQQEIDADTMQKLKGMLPYIPTGCNSHKLHFSIIEKKSVMECLKDKVNSKLIKLLSSKLMNPITKKFSMYKGALEKGEDIVFRNAPHMIVVSSPITAPCASVDPIIALSYFELYAQSLGIGTCWCGYAEVCIKLMPEICNIIEIPEGYVPVYAMLFGYPAVKYKRIPKPAKYKISEIKDVIPKSSCVFCNAKRLITNFLR